MMVIQEIELTEWFEQTNKAVDALQSVHFAAFDLKSVADASAKISVRKSNELDDGYWMPGWVGPSR